MPVIPLHEIKASQIGRDVVIREDRLKLVIQHAFLAGKDAKDGDIEKEAWDFAEQTLYLITNNFGTIN